jgi:putative transposase
MDKIPIYNKSGNESIIFSGYRKYRGLYHDKRSNCNINADINGSYNILRKAIPNVFVDGIEGVRVHPNIINIKKC